MWKWAVGVIGGAIILGGFACYVLLKKVTGAGNVAVVGIHDTPENIFFMLTNLDSVHVWSPTGGSMTRASGSGLLAPGDTLTENHQLIKVSTDNATGAEKNRVSQWVVRVVQAPTLFVLDGLGPADSSGRAKVMFSRRDSLVTQGDSTLVYSTFTVPGIESIQAQSGDSALSGGANATLGILGKLMSSVYRVAAESELRMLKLRMERPSR